MEYAPHPAIMKNLAKTLKNYLASILLAFNHRILKADTVLFFEPLLMKCLKRNPDFFFVQIGANDGVFYDSLFAFVTKHRVRGLVVEPLNDLFGQLAENYRPYPQIIPVRTAIHQSLKSVELHRPNPAKLHLLAAGANGIGSLNWEHHKKTGIPDDAMITETVPAMSLSELLEKNHVTRLDLLQIDTEGYDAEIIKMLDTTAIRPSIIRFEHGLSDGIMTTQTFAGCAEFLLKRGYYLIMEPNDAIAYDRELLS
jgi:FkbM family methyltransferase